MVNFRYHAISLVAVFFALAIGVVLGVALGDEGVVSGARHDLEKSLRGDLNKARGRNADLSSQLGTSRDYEQQTYPTLVRGLLRGDRVALLAIGNLPSDYGKQVKAAISPAGARLSSTSVVSSPLKLDDVAGDVPRRDYRRLARSPRVQRRLGRAIGSQLAAGGRLPGRVRGSLFSRSDGAYGAVDAIVLARDRDGLEGRDKRAEDAFEQGLIQGLRSSRATLVGVEEQGTDPSQISFFKDNDISTVDDIDLVAGHTALVYVLGGREGNFGTGDGVDLLPKPPRRR